jgi:hypothetical protein
MGVILSTGKCMFQFIPLQIDIPLDGDEHRTVSNSAKTRGSSRQLRFTIWTI